MDSIEMDLKEVGWEGVDWNRLAQNRDKYWQGIVNTEMNLWVPYNAGTFLTIEGSISFTRTLFHSVAFAHLTRVLYMTIFRNTIPFYNEALVKGSNFLSYGGMKYVLLSSGSGSFVKCTNGPVPRRECIFWMCLL